jgi:L-seryl-tRNA(Ser) seleniumtransferase
LRKHSLYRALRADKLRLAALEATLDSYARGATLAEVPTHRMIAMSFEELEVRAKRFIDQLEQPSAPSSLRAQVIEGESAIGGGAAPTSRLRTPLISITDANLTPNEIEARLRRSRPPIIARIESNQVLLDLRTVATDDETNLLSALISMANAQSS